MVELYWQSLTRDIPFDGYPASPLIAKAAAELSRLSGLSRSPRRKQHGHARQHLSRFNPWRSERALHLAVPIETHSYGFDHVSSTNRVGVPDRDYLTAADQWALDQIRANSGRGRDDGSHAPPLAERSRLRTVGALRLPVPGASERHVESSWTSVLRRSSTATPTSSTRPIRTEFEIGGRMVTFGIVQVAASSVSCVRKRSAPPGTRSGRVHRTLRPDAMGGRVHQTLAGKARYPIHPDLVKLRSGRAGIWQISKLSPAASLCGGEPLGPGLSVRSRHRGRSLLHDTESVLQRTGHHSRTRSSPRRTVLA
jgi:hypothetical protein